MRTQSFPEGYLPLAPLAAGARTAVYRARREADGLEVAIKLALPERPLGRERIRFHHEFAILSKARSTFLPSALAMLDAGGLPALVLDLIPAESLRQRLLATGPLPVEEAVALAIRTTEALIDLHGQGLLHRGLSAGNLLWAPATGLLKLVGLSTAGRFGMVDADYRNPSELEGELAYLAPELSGRLNVPPAPATDLYALGVMLYEALTGHRPFGSADPLELVFQHLTQIPPAPHELESRIPLPLSAVVMKLLEKEPSRRYVSAAGLMADMVELAGQLGSGAVRDFEPGRHDVADRLVFSGRLYGRQESSDQLLATFERVSTGAAGAALVAGPAGVGKTALVQTLLRPLTARRALFASGKFDQLQRALPLSALTSALNQLVRRLLTLSDAELSYFRLRIEAAVPADRQILLDIVPALQGIMGPQPALPTLPPAEAANRSDRVFQRFLQALGGPEHPLVLFLDDMQWADDTTLRLLKSLLTDPDSRHMLVLLACRSNEVDADHPFAGFMQTLQGAGRLLAELELRELPEPAIVAMLADALHRPMETLRPLARFVRSKTGGNPLFAQQFAFELERRGLLRFDRTARRWRWNLESIAAVPMTDNLVDLVAQRLAELPAATRQALAIAACVGAQFDLDWLALALDGDLPAAWQVIAPAIEADFLLASEERLVESSGQTLLVRQQLRFLHDRVQQAALSGLTADQRLVLEARIGQLMLAAIDDPEHDSRLFDALSHLNMAAQAVPAAQRLALARCNLIAGCRARDASAFDAAASFFLAGLGFVGEQGWQHDHRLWFELSAEHALAELAQSHFESVAERVAAILPHVGQALDRARLLVVMTRQKAAQGRLPEAIAHARDALTLLGFPLPEGDTGPTFQAEIGEALALVKSQSVAMIEFLPQATDEAVRLALELMTSLKATTYLSDPGLYVVIVERVFRMTLQHGIDRDSASGVTSFAILLSGLFGEYTLAFELGQSALRLASRLGNTYQQASVESILGIFLTHWVQPFPQVLEHLEVAVRVGHLAGHAEYVRYTLFHQVAFLWSRGEPLELVAAQLERAYAYCARTFNQLVPVTYHAFDMLRRNVAGETAGEHVLDCGELSEARYLETMRAQNFRYSFFYLNTYRAMLACLYRDFERAWQHCQEAARFERAAISLYVQVDYVFWRALTLCAQAAVQAESEAEIGQLLARLRNWAERVPETYRQKVYLIEAEMQRRADRPLADCLDGYERAIAEAERNGFLVDLAMAHELTARYLITAGRERIARPFLEGACQAYRRWGARRKLEQLLAEFGDLEQPAAVAASVELADVDLLAVQRALEAISGSLRLDELVFALLGTMLQFSGAEVGAVLLERAGLAVVVRGGMPGSYDQRRFDADPAGGGLSAMLGLAPELAEPVLRYAIRLDETVCVDDVRNDERFAAPGIRARSVLALPLLHQGRRTGLLMLQHMSLPQLFTPSRLSVLELIGRQAAVSLENAVLYGELASRYEFERRRSESELHDALIQLAERERHLQTILDFSPTPIWVKRLDGSYQQVNPAWSSFYGIEREMALGHGDRELFGREVATRLALHDRMALDGEGPLTVEERVPSPEGYKTTLTCRFVLRDASGSPYALCGMATDISVRKEAELVLGRERSRLQEVIDAADAIITLKDRQGRYLLVNRAFEQAVGLPRSAVVGQSARGVLPLEVAARVERADREALAEGHRINYEENLRYADGSQRVCLINRAPLFDADGEVWALCALATDITRLKDVETELVAARQQAEAASRAKSEFLANMSHEIRTPMNAVIGYAQLLERDAALPDRQREQAQIIKKSGEHLLALIDNVLEMSKIEAGQQTLTLQAFDPHGMVQDIFRMFGLRAEAKGLQLALRVADDMPGRLRGDERKLRQIVINLLGNALKFTEQGGVELRLAGHMVAELFRLRLEVLDTGVGIAPEDRSKVFARFEQTSSGLRMGGTGLGLAICRQFAEAMGGHLDFDSEPGRGSRFWLVLDCAVETAPVHVAPVLRTVRRLQGLRVLVADDNGFNRDLARDLLTELGAEVATAEDGLQVLAQMAGEPEFDIVLLDLDMPHLGGLDTARTLRQRGCRLPLVALTAAVLDTQLAGCHEAGIDDILTKPFRVEALEAMLCRWTQRPVPEGDASAVVPLSISGLWPVFDPDDGLQRTGANLTRYAQLIRRFQARAARLAQEFAAAGESGDLAVQQLAHAVRGIALQLGVVRLGRWSEQIERTAAAGEPLQALLSMLPEVVEEWRQAAADWLAAHPEPPSAPQATIDRDGLPVQWLAQLQTDLQAQSLDALATMALLQPHFADQAQAAALQRLIESLDFAAAQALLRQLIHSR